MAGTKFKIEGPEGKAFRTIKTPCGVTAAHDAADAANHTPIKFTALWDTGATNTVISQNVVESLQLKPIAKVKTLHANGESIVDAYSVNMLLPNQVGFQYLTVTKGILADFDVLIGMDIIAQGEFIIRRERNHPIFEFSLPYATEIQSINLPAKPVMSRAEPTFKDVGRNDLCPCNSGKKFKNCHGLGTYFAEAMGEN